MSDSLVSTRKGFYTFDEVMAILKIDEQKLKRLVSEGEIMAYRNGDQMEFLKRDIDVIYNVASAPKDEEPTQEQSRGEKRFVRIAGFVLLTATAFGALAWHFVVKPMLKVRDEILQEDLEPK